MLSIYYGLYKGENYIDNPDLYFDNTYEDAWLEDPHSKAMVKDIDKSELIGPNLVISPVLGSIPVSRLSGGVKIGKAKDVLVRLGHQMRFTEEPFDIRIENTGQVVHTRKELVTAVISQGLLEETL